MKVSGESKPRSCLTEAPLTAYNKAFFLHASSKQFFSVRNVQRFDNATQGKLNKNEQK